MTLKWNFNLMLSFCLKMNYSFYFIYFYYYFFKETVLLPYFFQTGTAPSPWIQFCGRPLFVVVNVLSVVVGACRQRFCDPIISVATFSAPLIRPFGCILRIWSLFLASSVILTLPFIHLLANWSVIFFALFRFADSFILTNLLVNFYSIIIYYYYS